MVTQRELLGTFSYFFILALALFLYQHAMFAEALQASSVGMFIFLLYIGIAEFYWLFKYFMRYFHWFFHKKEQVIVDYPSFEVLEKKTIILDAPMKYVPGYEAFREGPAVLQLFYDLVNTPDLIFLDGHGIAHPMKAGLATYIGVELENPVIGVDKKLSFGEIVDEKLIVDGEERGMVVKTKEHANPLCVSPGHLVSINTAVEWVRKTIIPPHKKPEPLHIASRMAKKAAKKVKE